jgi:hypothetical protein
MFPAAVCGLLDEKKYRAFFTIIHDNAPIHASDAKTVVRSGPGTGIAGVNCAMMSLYRNRIPTKARSMRITSSP